MTAGAEAKAPGVRWADIAARGGIREWVDAEISRLGLQDPGSGTISESEKKAYKARRDEERRVRLARLQAPDRSPEMENALKARAQELKRMGLAVEIERNIFQFEPGWRDALKAMELHLDVRKALMQARANDVARRLSPAQTISKMPGTPTVDR